MGNLLLAQASALHAPADDPPPAQAPAAAVGREGGVLLDRSFIILNAPQDMDAFWQKIEHPDFMLLKAVQPRDKDLGDASQGTRAELQRWLIESVQVRGQVIEDFANLAVELLIVVKGAETVWAPIRLDGQSLTRARDRKSVV